MREYKRYTYVNSGNTRKSTSMNRKRALTSLLRGNSRGIQGAWKDVALDGRLEIHATAANSDQQ